MSKQPIKFVLMAGLRRCLVLLFLILNSSLFLTLDSFPTRFSLQMQVQHSSVLITRNLRKYLLSQSHPIKIIDFRDAQIFKNVTSYTCLTFVDKSKRNEVISYTRIAEENSLSKHIFSEYEFYQFKDGKPWRMRQSSVDSVIAKLENTGEPLSHWKIRNGLATLKNDLYFSIFFTQANHMLRDLWRLLKIIL